MTALPVPQCCHLMAINMFKMVIENSEEEKPSMGLAGTVEDNIKMGIVEICFGDAEYTVWTSERRACSLLCINLIRLRYFVVVPGYSLRYFRSVAVTAGNSKWSSCDR
jgi:hypothetical protein